MATIAELLASSLDALKQVQTMLASGGYDWLIVSVERRDEYMAALEKASVEGDIVPFVRFLSGI